MKFLEYTPIARLSSFLQYIDLGDHIIEGDLQAYSCKLAGIDKKLSRSLDQEVVSSLSTTPPAFLSSSPVGPLTESQSRKTLIYLILTLNHVYPDYDFSMLRAEHFRKEADVTAAKAFIDHLLMEPSKVWTSQPGEAASFIDVLWDSIDEVIDLRDCDVYSYHAEMEGDPFAEEGQVWAVNHFFYNKKQKRILYFFCRSKMARNAHLDYESEHSDNDMLSDEPEDDLAYDMEI